MGKDSITETKIERIFVNKYSDYREMMKLVGSSEEKINAKLSVVNDYKNKSLFQKADIIVDDISFLNNFTNGLVLNDGDTRLYEGINQEIAHSVACDMTSMSPYAVLPKKYQDEIDSDTVRLMEIKDKVNSDICELIPDTKRMYLEADAEGFHNCVSKIYDSEQIQLLSDLIDESVIHGVVNQDSMRRYDELINEGKKIAKDINFDVKSKYL